MEGNHFERAEILFHRALSVPSIERHAFIETESNGDARLAARVRRLISFAEKPSPTIGLLPSLPTDSADDEADALLGVTIDRYRIESRLGDGGFGVVYEAEQLHPVQRRVAMKVLRSGMDSCRVINRFSAERQALAMMDHPSIARIFDAGQTDESQGSRPYFVMELVAGLPITEYCAAHTLDSKARLQLFVTVCQAVQHAHQKGIIHRDLKPSNILVTEVDGIATPKVIDFGIAKAMQQGSVDQVLRTQVTEVQQILGTPQYMSPEQADVDVQSIDTRTDIYSLGVILYELLTGTTPVAREHLRGASSSMMQQRIRSQGVERPSTRVARLSRSAMGIAHDLATDARTLRRTLRGDLDWIVLRALEPERERRYSSAAAFADDIHRYLNHEPVQAGPPGAVYRTRKFIRRHRVGTVATSLVLLAMIGGMVGIAMGLLRAQSAAEQTAAINEFMRDILTSAAPDQLGSAVRLVDVLQNGSEAASQRFAGHPETEAQVRDLLGQVYIALDSRSESVAEFAKSAALWRDVAGPFDRRTIAVELRHVRSLLNQSNGREAERVLNDVLPRAERVFESDDPLMLDALLFKASSARYRGRVDEAETLLRDLRGRFPEHDDQRQVELLNNLVLVLTSRFGAGSREDDKTYYREALALSIEIAERSTRHWGASAHPTLRALTTVADMRWRLGDVDEAILVAQDILQRAEGRFDHCHTTYLNAVEVLATALNRQGEPAASADYMLELIRCVRSRNGTSIALLVAISDNLPIIDRGGRWVEGEALAREYGALLQNLGGGHGAMMLAADLWVARFVSLQGRTHEADQLFAALLARDDEVSQEAQTFARFHAFLANHLARQRQFELAEDHLLEARGALADVRVGTSFATPDDVVMEFVLLYEAWGKADKVSEFEQLHKESLEMAIGLR